MRLVSIGKPSSIALETFVSVRHIAGEGYDIIQDMTWRTRMKDVSAVPRSYIDKEILPRHLGNIGCIGALNIILHIREMPLLSDREG